MPGNSLGTLTVHITADITKFESELTRLSAKINQITGKNL